MQLVPALPLPVSTPPVAGQPPADPLTTSAPASGKDGSAFAQLFPDLAPTEVPAVAPAGKPPADNRLAGEAAMSLFAGWFAALAPAGPPPIPAAEATPVPPAGVPATGLSASMKKGGVGVEAQSPLAGDPLAPDASLPFAAQPSPKGGARSALRTPTATSGPDQAAKLETSTAGLPAAITSSRNQPGLPQSGTAKESIASAETDAASPGSVASAETLNATVEMAPAVKPADRSKLSAITRGEKNAQSDSKTDAALNSSLKSTDKKVLMANDKEVTGPIQSLGTDAAKTAVTMSNAASSERQPGALPAPALTSAATAQLDRFAREAPAATSDTASVAHQAVEAAMTAADRQVSGESRTVNLQFSVGNADLNVRVEMRDGALHATFRTDSADLRDALAHEWQSVSSSPGDRPFRLADPVFAPANPSGLASAGDNAPQHQRQGGDRASSSYAPAHGFAPDPSGSEPALATLSAASDSTPLSTSQHLHTFA